MPKKGRQEKLSGRNGAIRPQYGKKVWGDLRGWNLKVGFWLNYIDESLADMREKYFEEDEDGGD